MANMPGSNSSTQRYIVEMYYVDKDSNYTQIPSENISSIIFDYDYDNKNMPIIYVSFNVNSKIYDEMVVNKDTSKIHLIIKKKNINSASSLTRVVIKDEFKYLIPTDVDYHRPLDKLGNAKELDTGISYKKGIMALTKIDVIEDNYRLNNTIIKNSNMSSIIHKFTNHMVMVIEPLERNDTIKWIIIPPIPTITELLKYLDSYQTFYKSGYRYFRDLNKTYLLSTSGNPVIDSSDKYNTVLINIMETLSDETKYSGAVIDESAKAYVLYVDALDTGMNLPMFKTTDSYIGVSSTGNIKKCGDYVDPLTNIKEKFHIHRVFNDNLDYIDSINNVKDSTDIVLIINRAELDASILTPNKEYIVKNYREYQEYNGRFVLSSKKEILIQQDNEFISSTSFTLRKVIE